ncbi:MAG TPA: serine hydrolase [Steroidobacteraceae bacterium]|nr:serine hydrolase [Steroidobacteraceae bacterium]
MSASEAAPAPPPHHPITAAELHATSWSGGVIDNSAFTPPKGAAAAHEPFLGTLRLSEASMPSQPTPLSAGPVLGRDPQLFPGVELAFFTDSGDLVPVTQDVIRYAAAGRGKSYWDVLVQPGRVWSEPADDGWSRAAFPFALINSIEGETHNGLATFLYRASQVSNLRFQIVQQTSPFYIKPIFTAAGLVPAAPGAAPKDLTAAKRALAAERTDRVRISDWQALAAKVGAERLAGFDGTMKTGEIVLAGLDYEGTFYLEECRSAGGPLPWCDRARFGVWSATKALANEAALLHLAQKYGPGVFDLRIRDYVREAAAHPGWNAVRFDDAIDMATGIGNGSARSEPNEIEDGYLDKSYARWYEARSVDEKVEALLEDGRTYPWGPGKVVRYRDQDMFILGVAMDRFLKSKEGPSADLWTMLRREVYEPIGIHDAPVNRTTEADGRPGQPLMAYGYYPTLGDMIRIARLYQNGGRHGERQILYAPRLRELLSGRDPKGRPTGEHLKGGETTYTNAFWVSSYAAAGGCRVFYPRMIGWGANIVALMPDGLTGIRLAHSDGMDIAAVETAGMAHVADGLAPFCR